MTLKEIGLLSAGAAAAITIAVLIGADDPKPAEFNCGGSAIQFTPADCATIKAAFAASDQWDHAAEDVDYGLVKADCSGVVQGKVVALMSEPPADARSITKEFVEALKVEAGIIEAVEE